MQPVPATDQRNSRCLPGDQGWGNHFAARRWTVADELANNAHAIYLFHYLFVVWLQYALLSLTLSAIVKATIVFGAALLLSWAAAIATRRTLENVRKLGSVPRPS